MSVVAHNFTTGEVIKAYDNSPEYGRIILAQHISELTKDKQGKRWLKKSTRTAFIQGKMSELQEDYGHLESGDVAFDDMCIAKSESLKPFWTQEVTAEDGTVTIKKQEPKKRPANLEKGTPEKIITHNGKPVYMQFSLEDLGTKDVLIEDVVKPASVAVVSDVNDLTEEA